jgi:hypothetical protein
VSGGTTTKKGWWYATGMEVKATALESDARRTRLRVARMGTEYQGEALAVYGDAMEAAAKELRRAAAALRQMDKEPRP